MPGRACARAADMLVLVQAAGWPADRADEYVDLISNAAHPIEKRRN